MGFANIGNEPRDLLAEDICNANLTIWMDSPPTLEKRADGTVVAVGHHDQPNENDYALADALLSLVEKFKLTPRSVARLADYLVASDGERKR